MELQPPTPPFYAVMTAQLERYVMRSRRGIDTTSGYTKRHLLSQDDPRTAVRICGIEVLTRLSYSAM